VGDKDTKKKPEKPEKPKLPGKKPPKSDKEATAKYNAATDFLDCKGTTLTLKPGKLDWLGLDITPDATFEADKNKPGTINIKVDLGLGSVTLPASVKDGKLNVDTSNLPLGAEDVNKFVDGLNGWLEANGWKLGGATLKGGAITLTKEALAAAPEKKEVKGGLLPHVPTWEKVGAAGLFGISVVFGVGFMNAGDETKTVSSAGGNQAATGGAPNPYKTVTAVRVTPPERPPVDAPATSGKRVETVVPLFVKSPHRVALVGVQGNPVDSFVLPVPSDEGTVKGSTERGGTFDCAVSHRQGVNGSPSSAKCAVQPPSRNAVPATNAGPANPAEVARTTETTEGKPWSLLVIPGVALFVAFLLLLEEWRRRAAVTEVM
jgi:hypothetical protein